MNKWINEQLDAGIGYREMLRLFRQAVICEALLRSGWRTKYAKTRGNISEAARLLGVHRNNMGHWMKNLRTETGQDKAA